MKTLSIIRADDMVVVDGVGFKVDCGALPSYLHALQWNGAAGEIEWSVDERGQKMPNTKIVDLSPYSFLLDDWQAAKRRAELKAEEARVAAENAASERAEALDALRIARDEQAARSNG